MIKKATSYLFTSIIFLLFIIASCLISIRLFLPNINQYSDTIADHLSSTLSVDVSIGSLEANWDERFPKIIIKDIDIVNRDFIQRKIKIEHIHAQVNIAQSLLSFAPIFETLQVNHLHVSAEQVSKRWLNVFSTQQANSNNVTEPNTSRKNINRMLKIITKQTNIEFSNAYLTLQPENLPSRMIGPMNFLIENDNSLHQLKGEAELKYYGDKSKVSFAVEAEELSSVISQTPVSLYANFENLSHQLLNFNLINLNSTDTKNVSIDSKMWATLQNGIISDVIGHVDINHFEMAVEKYPLLKDSSFNFSVLSNDDVMKVQLDDIHLSDGEEIFKMDVANAEINNSKVPFLKKIGFSSVDLSNISQLLIKDINTHSTLRDVLNTLNLKGKVDNLSLQWQDRELKNVLISADLNDVSVNSYNGAPELKNVNGLLKATATGGEIHLNTNDFSLNFPRLFPKKWDYKKAEGKVSWHLALDEKGKVSNVLVNSELLNLSTENMKAAGRFSVNIPSNKAHQTELILLIGMQNNDTQHVVSYIPPGIVGQSLNDWIHKAAVSGKLNQGGIILRTGFRKDTLDSTAPSVKIFLDLESVIANFDDKWPEYYTDTLDIVIEDNEVTVNSKKGLIAGNDIVDLQVSKGKDNPEIHISLGINGAVNSLFKGIKEKPARDYIPEPLQEWDLSGWHQSILKLVIPIDSPKTEVSSENKVNTIPYIDLTSDFDRLVIKDESNNLEFENINGLLRFNSLTGFSLDNISFLANGSAAQLSIASEKKDEQLKTSILLESKIDVADIIQQLDLSDLPFLKGAANYDARIDFCTIGASCNQLVVNSDLVGVSADLPTPWYKKANQKSKLQVVNNLSNNEQENIWQYNYANLIRGITVVSEDKTSTSITLGGVKPQSMVEEGVSINGELNGIELKEFTSSLIETLSTIKGDSNKDSAADSVLKTIDLKLKRATLLGQSLGNSAWLTLKYHSDHWLAKFNSQVMAGQIKYPHQSSSPINVDLNKLSLKTNKNKAASSDSVEVINFTQWPKVNVNVSALEINDLNVGEWKAALAPTEEGYKVSNINGKLAQTEINSEISWFSRKGQARSFLSLDAQGGDFGTVLKQFGYSKVLENKSGQVQVDLSWDGLPWDFDQSKLNGRASFSLKEGRIIEAGNSANFLRIFGILNLNTVIKRLKLNFTDLLETGVAFDTVTGKYYLQDGIATSQEPMQLKGSSASIEMSGNINFVEKTLDQKMTVEIPLSSNAPIAALLLASPQVAGIAFVVDKIFGNKIAKLTALKYVIDGSWFEPNVKAANLLK